MLNGILPPQSGNPRVIRFTESKLPGCFAVEFPAFRDSRGLFVKTIQRSVFEQNGLSGDFSEVFYTTSGKDVLRGMHFQVPPADHAKLVYCISGSIYDMALDLRMGSPTYGQYEVFELSAEENNAVYLASGIAHGFFVRNAPATVVYHVTSEHNPEYDKGILWSSFGAAWPIANPAISDRDAAQVHFADFQTPFVLHARSESAGDKG